MSIIKAGTYTFKETPSFEGISFTSDSGESGMFVIPVRCTFPFTYNGINYEVTASTLYLWNHTASDYPDEQHYQILGDVESVTPSDKDIKADSIVQLYNSSPNKLWESGSRTITVLEDTEIDNTVAYNWFTANIEDVAEDPTTSIIKSGTYKFNSVLTETLPAGEYPLNFTWVSDDSEDLYKSIYISFQEGFGYYLCLWGVDNDIPTEMGSFGDIWFASAYSIIIDKEQEVSDEFATWFTENTQMLIKAGTYKGNATLTKYHFVDTTVGLNIPFCVDRNFTLDFENGIVLETPISTTQYSIIKFIKALDSAGNETFNVQFCSFDDTTVSGKQMDSGEYFDWVYSSTFGWSTLSLVLGNSANYNPPFQNTSLIIGYGQIITITEDTYVPTNFGLWANENWHDYAEEPDTPEGPEETVIIKAGTYKFDDTPDMDTLSSIIPTDESLLLSFSSFGRDFLGVTVDNLSSIRYIVRLPINYMDDAIVAYSEHGWTYGDVTGGGYKVITVTEDAEVPAEFATWFEANTEPVEEKITDLTDTTWTIPAGWIAPGYVSTMDAHYKYYITGSITYGGNTHEGLICFRASNSSYLYFLFEGKSFYLQNTNDVTFNITGGEDATNPDLIAWFESGGTIRCTKTLKGVWRFKESINFPNESNTGGYTDLSHNLDFINRAFTFNGSTQPGGPESYSTMAIHSGRLTIEYTERHHDGLEWLHSTYTVYDGSGTGWYSDENRYVALLYEQDVTNEFYNWFTSNADDVTSSFSLIHYMDKLIGMVEDGHSCYLDVKNLLMNTDVTISVPETKLLVVSPAPDSTTPTLKGVWRFKEVITATKDVSVGGLNLKIVGFDHSIYLNIDTIDVDISEGDVSVGYTFEGYDGIYTGGIYYKSHNGWEDETYRYLYVPAETSVPQDFYDWFIANAENITDCATYIKYADEVIGVLLGGMTARLPCKDLTMTSVIRITAPKA